MGNRTLTLRAGFFLYALMAVIAMGYCWLLQDQDHFFQKAEQAHWQNAERKIQEVADRKKEEELNYIHSSPSLNVATSLIKSATEWRIILARERYQSIQSGDAYQAWHHADRLKFLGEDHLAVHLEKPYIYYYQHVFALENALLEAAAGSERTQGAQAANQGGNDGI